VPTLFVASGSRSWCVVVWFVLFGRNNQPAGVMQVGHTFTIEPMICEGTNKHILWPVRTHTITPKRLLFQGVVRTVTAPRA
jgi:methionine aminopeptidase